MMRETAPVVHLPKYDAYAIGRYEEVRWAMRDLETFDTTAGIGLADITKPGSWGRKASAFSEQAPEPHARNRGVLTRIMSPIVIRKWKSDFEREASQTINELNGRYEIDAVRDIAEPYILRAISGAVGLQMTRDQMVIAGEINFNQLGPNNERLAETLRRAEPHMAWYDRQLTREGLVPGGVGWQIYEAADKGLIPEETAPEMIKSFLRAGTDSTISGISSALRYLAMAPEQWDLLRADPSKARTAFEEATRLESPVSISYRKTTRDVNMSGYEVPSGSKLGLWFGSANRDPRRWKNADQFDLGRDLTGHMAFGDGPHVCLGQNVARMEGEVILAAMAARFKKIELTGEPEYKVINALKALETLPVRLIPA